MVAALQQNHFRFRTDTDAVDAGPTWGANEDINFYPADATFRLRFSVENIDASQISAEALSLFVSLDGGTFVEVTQATVNPVATAAASSTSDGTRIVIPQLDPPPVLFSPTMLFAASETGGWWDPSDLSTMFQDTAGTTPVTAAGQRVARINDKSANGNNLLNTTGNQFRYPLLANSGSLWWLAFRSITDGLAYSLSDTFTLNQPATRIMATQNVTFSAGAYLYDGGSVNTNVLAMRNSSPEVDMYAGLADTPGSTTDMTIGINHVTTEVFNGALSSFTVDNGTTNTGNPGANNAGGLTVGNTGSISNGSDINWYGGVDIGRTLTSGEMADCRTFFGAKAGLTL